jgi:hypothetical protein
VVSEPGCPSLGEVGWCRGLERSDSVCLSECSEVVLSERAAERGLVERSEATQACLLMPCTNVVSVRLRLSEARSCVAKPRENFFGVLAIVSGYGKPRKR